MTQLLDITLTRKGVLAERIAADFLEKQGLRVISQNFHGKHGEIDLICKERDTIVFVEVRHRSRRDYGSASATINRSKQTKIMKTATVFLLQQGWYNKKVIRFDIVAINGVLHDTPDIEWIKQAFY